MMPNGWKKTLLGNVMEFKNGLNFTKNDTGEDIKIVGVANFKDLSELHSTEHLEVVRVADKIRDEELLTNGDLLFVRSNGNKELIGRCLYFPSVSERLSFSGFTIRGRAKQEFVMPQYIAAVARSWFMKQQISKNGGGTNISNLSQQILNDIVLPLPKLDEQKKITEVLSIWDKAIGMTEKLLINSQQQRKALMQQLLTGKRRLLDKNGVRFSSEWKTCRLGDIGEIKSAGVDKKSVEGEMPVRLLNFTDVFKKTFIFSNEINHWVTAPYSKVDGCSVLKGDVFFTPSSETRDEVGMSAVVASHIESCCYSYHIVRFRIKEDWDLNFKAFAFSTSSFRKQVSLLADGSGQRYVVSQDGFRSVIISYPPIEEQHEIGKVLRLAEEKTIILEKKLSHLKQEKKALMQQLLTGKRRVKVDAA